MIYRIAQTSLRGTKYTVILFDTVKEIEDYSRIEALRKDLEDRYDENLIFVTNEKGGQSTRNATGRVPFDTSFLLGLPFQPVNI